ncbi:MAG: ATP-binding protein [Clostridiaceae bacterium]
MIIIKSLKVKLISTYITLVLIITLVGIIAVYNVFNLGRSIDGLITNNYKSIDAVNNINNCIENQDKAILKYISFQKEESIDLFYKNNDEFYKWFYIQKNNITEEGEQDLVEALNKDYIEFVKLFSSLQQYSSNHNNEEMMGFYNNAITPKMEEIKKDLINISKLNETAMFKGKNTTKANAENSIKIIFIVSFIAAVTGLIISVSYTKKYLLKPIHLLTDTIKSIKEGELNKQAPVIYNDEIGMLATEFNNMTNRLYEFEKSTKGTLLAEKNRSITIVKSISDPLIVFDSSFKIKLINNSCETFFKLKEKFVLNKHFLQVIKNVDLYDHAFKIINNDLEETEKTIEIEMNGKIYFFNITVTIIKGTDSKINGIIMLFKNVTELKQLEIIKTDFIGTISHELKTPLTSAMMGVGLLLDKNLGEFNSKQKIIIETIKEDVQKLNDLVSNLLKISKIQSDRGFFDFKSCCITSVIYNCVDSFKSKAEEKEINLHYELPEDLPKVTADEEKITWVLNNLISNAIKYSDNSGEILVGGFSNNSKLYIYVKDTGIGIPEEYLTKVFDKFVRVESNDMIQESNGLGLAIAKEIVEIHGGIIWCESKLGVGSVFTFMLPVEK